MDGGGERSAERGIEPLPIVYESDYPGEIEETFEEYMAKLVVDEDLISWVLGYMAKPEK